jgi:hypothetical protein
MLLPLSVQWWPRSPGPSKKLAEAPQTPAGTGDTAKHPPIPAGNLNATRSARELEARGGGFLRLLERFCRHRGSRATVRFGTLCLDPPGLRKLVAHLCEVADPDAAAAQTQWQHARRGLWVSATMAGMVAVDGLPPACWSPARSATTGSPTTTADRWRGCRRRRCCRPPLAAPPPSRWRSAAPPGWSAPPNGPRWRSATAAAPSPAATGHRQRHPNGD